ncbi:MAG: hypothetical protein HKL98_05265 [Burkholderiales bacterium]|nr:hypothetical protein [Burkholderiales bacterium]
MARVDEGMDEELSPHKRYALISEKAYFLGEERRRREEPADPAADWMMAEALIDNLIGFGAV